MPDSWERDDEVHVHGWKLSCYRGSNAICCIASHSVSRISSACRSGLSWKPYLLAEVILPEPPRRVHPTDPKIAAFRNEESVENDG